MMTAGTGGFSGSASATGPNAGFDPIMKFRKKLKKTKVKLTAGNTNESFSESKENPKAPSRLFQYKVKLPEVGETIVYATSPAELTRKLRMVIAPGHRGDIEIERVLPAAAGKFFMDKRTKHMRNIMGEEAVGASDAKEMADERVRAERKRAALKKQELQKRLQTKTRQLKKSAAAGQAAPEEN